MNPHDFLAFEDERHQYLSRSAIDKAAVCGFAYGLMVASAVFGAFIWLTGGF